ATGQEARLEIAVRAFDQPLGFGITGLAEHRTHAERTTEPVERLRRLRPATVTRRERSLVVIHTNARDRAELDETGEMPAEDVVRLTRRDHASDEPARIARHADEHRRPAVLIEPERDVDRREP